MCINNKKIVHSSGICSIGTGLIEGKVYTATGETYIHPNNKKECYLILELYDLKLTTRFIPVSDIDETELFKIEEVPEEIS